MPRETLIFDHGERDFIRSDYPWAVAIRITIQGGRGGAAPDGTPGEEGESKSEVFVAAELPVRLRVVVGRGGRGSGGGQPGEDAYAIVELYDREVER